MTAAEIVEQLYKNDEFSRWLGVTIVDIQEGYCKVEMQVRSEMCNGFGIAHGGITFSLADSALAFASNSSGKHAVSIETSISHTKKVQPGDVLTATAQQVNLTNAIGIYNVKVENQNGDAVALFKGTVYRSRPWQKEAGDH